jgi:hypothetical protein
MAKSEKKQAEKPFAFKGKISIHNRSIHASAERAMQGGIFMPLIELITNSNDSYERMGQKNRKIVVSYKKNKGTCLFSVTDNAEGLDIDDFDKKLTKYWNPSEHTETNSQRGYFGKGAKDALGYMSDGRIASFKDGKFILCTIYFDENQELTYEVLESCKATPKLRKKYGVKENGTVASFIADPDSGRKVKIPQFKTVHEELSNHYLLRKILQEESIKLVLVNEKGRKKDKRTLAYVEPKGSFVSSENFEITYDKYEPFEIQMNVSRSDTTLSQKDKGDTRQGGLLIIDDKDVVLDISLFKYDYDPIASKLYGEVVISGFRKLLKDNEVVLSPERDGVVRNHPFIESLIKELNKRLDRIVQKEKERMQRFDVTDVGREHLKRQKEFCRILNEIAETELDYQEEKAQKDLPYPLNGFYMFPESSQVSADSHTVFTLRIDTKKVKPGTWLNLKTTNQTFKFENKDDRILVPAPKKKRGKQADDAFIVTKHVTVIGTKPHETGKISVHAPDRTATSKLYITPPEDLSEYGVTFQFDNIVTPPNKPRKVLMFAYPKVIKTGDVIYLESDNPNIHVNIEEIIVDESEDMVKGVLKYELEVWGEGEGQEGAITATCDSFSGWKCENMMGIELKYKKPNKNSIKNAVFSPHEYRSDPEPPQAASYSNEMERVFIYTKFPTVSYYLGEDGVNIHTLPAQIYIANLVMDRYFYRMAFKAVDNSGIILSERNKYDAIQRKVNELIKKHGNKLLSAMVDQKLMKKTIKEQKKDQ